MISVHCILNGSKQKSKPLIHFISNCRSSLGNSFVLSETTEPLHASKIAEKVREKIILIIGGDGTVNEVMNGWVKNELKPKIVIIPYGTGNDFVRGINSIINFDNFINCIHHSDIVEIDLPFVQQENSIRYFVNICDIGFGGEVVRKLNQNRKRFGPRFSYAISTVQTFLTYRKKTISLSSENLEIRRKSLMIAICNGPMFGDGLIIQPDANAQDSLLHFAFFGEVSLLDYLLNIRKLWRGFKINHKKVIYGIEQRFIVTADEEVFGECDGELFMGKYFTIGISAYKFPLIIGCLKN